MEPAIPDKSAVLTKVGQLPEVSEVALCKLNLGDQNIVTILRVVGKEEEDGKTTYLVRSDKNTSAEIIRVKPEDIVGKATWNLNALGTVIAFARSSLGILLLIIIPSALLLISLLISILKNINDQDEIEVEGSDNFKEDNYKQQEIKEDIKEEVKEEFFTKPVESKPFIDIIKEQLSDEPKVEEKAPEIIAEKKKVSEMREIPVQKEPEAAAPHVTVDENGVAEYNKITLTSNVRELEKTLPKTPKSHSDLASQSIDNLLKSMEATKKPSDSIKKAENNANEDNFISPRTKKTDTNKTLEDLMKMLDKEQNK